jgi:ectoine hydroxylase-related dioxygenase (phytanoyl-CoA dioxygenase family)/ubiquinone/menaquinone biosynthesis C-methylase UbiE
MKVVNDVDAVERYYDEWTGRYLEVYGDMIQAFRSADDKDTLGRIANSIGFKPGEHILDAGCGVGGPARFFAQNNGVTVEGVTVSQVQVDTAKEKNLAAGLDDKIKIKKADFHTLTEHFNRERFDKVLFLESLGHSKEPEKVLKGAFDVLKPGGYVYIKDFYAKESDNPEYQAYIDRLVNNINVAYSYNTLDLNVVLKAMRRAGFEVEFIRPVPIEHDIEVRADFESKFGIDLFESGLDFPYADWLEIKCWKPTYRFKNQKQFVNENLQAAYDKQGFVTTPLLSADEVKQLSDWFYANQPDTGGNFQATIEIQDAEYRRKVNAMVKEVIGSKIKKLLPGYRAIVGGYVIKPPAEGGIKKMHSDWQYTDETVQPSFSVWVPLLPVNKENGAMMFIPGSHKHAALLRGQHTVNAYDIIEPILKADRVVTIEQPPGEAVIFDQRILHGSGENFTTVPRLAMTLTIAPVDADLIHFYRDTVAQPHNTMTKYVVPEHFYLDYDFNFPPDEKYKVGEVVDKNLDWVVGNLKTEYAKGDGPLFVDKMQEKPIAKRKVMVAEADEKAMEVEGYVIKPFLSPQEIAYMQGLWDQETAGLTQSMVATTMSTNKAFREHLHAEICRIFTPKLNAILKDYKPLSGAYIMKRPSPDSALVTHFDWMFVDERRYASLHVWVPLVDVDATNGAFQILPRSHSMVNAWRGQNTLDSIFFNNRTIKAGAAQTLNMKAGEALIYDNRLIHGTPPNTSQYDRLAAGLVMIPNEATPIHVYTPAEKMHDEDVEVYEVDEQFYFDHDIRERPVGYKFIEKVRDTRRGETFRLLEEAFLEPIKPEPQPVAEPVSHDSHEAQSLLEKIKRTVFK